MALTITATSGTIASVGGDPGEPPSIAITPPTDVELTVLVPPGTDPAKVKLTRDGADVAATFTAGTGAAALALTTTLTDLSEDQLGRYTATLDGGDAASLVIRKAVTDGGGATPSPERVLEVEPGEYDATFAWTTGVAAAVVGGLFIVITLVSICRVPMRADQVVVTSGWVANTLADRVAGVVQLGALGLGAVVLVIGGWQAALEVRGRLNVTVVARSGDVDRGPTPAGVAEAVAQVVEVLRGARGTVVTLVVGAVVVLGALGSAAYVASSSHGPEPVPSTTTTPTSPPSSTSVPTPSTSSSS